MGFGTSADLQDAVRGKIARIDQMKDILEENGEKATRGRANEVLKLYNKFERFTADKEYRLNAYGSINFSAEDKRDKNDTTPKD